MLINFRCECKCKDRLVRVTNASVSVSCAGVGVTCDRRTSGDQCMMANGDCYRHLSHSNSSSVLYGSCPQLHPHTQQPAQLTAANGFGQSLSQPQRGERLFSSLVRPAKQRSPVLCQRCAV